MSVPAALRRSVAALASLALLLAALTPTLAHLLLPAPRSGPHGIDSVICTAQGPQRVVLAARGTDAPVAPAVSLHDHCPFCAWHADVLAPPPGARSIAGVAAAATVPAQAPSTARPQPAWAGAQPRAPPVLS
jgi:hypothetical protein